MTMMAKNSLIILNQRGLVSPTEEALVERKQNFRSNFGMFTNGYAQIRQGHEPKPKKAAY